MSNHPHHPNHPSKKSSTNDHPALLAIHSHGAIAEIRRATLDWCLLRRFLVPLAQLGRQLLRDGLAAPAEGGERGLVWMRKWGKTLEKMVEYP